MHRALWAVHLFLLSFFLMRASSVWAEWEPLGPYGGNALRILMDSNKPQRLFVFTKNGQCFRSENGGDSWKFIPVLLPKSATLNAAILDPRNSDILYIGVADQFMRGTNSFEGVYKSVEGGRHWEILPQTSGWSVLSLAISKDRPQELAAGPPPHW